MYKEKVKIKEKKGHYMYWAEQDIYDQNNSLLTHTHQKY